jgi:hypothetical protein
LQEVVVFQYDHTANIHEIRLDTNVPITGGTTGLLRPVGAGFWAVFLLGGASFLVVSWLFGRLASGNRPVVQS